MFRGINTVNLDTKNRFAIPTKYRSQLTDEGCHGVVITIDTDEQCLLLYPLKIWEEIEQKLQALPSFQPATRRIQRLLIGHATEIDMDSQGRLLLPQLLKEHAELDKKMILVGQGKKFEIWSEDCWQRQRSQWLNLGVSTSEDGNASDVLDTISV